MFLFAPENSQKPLNARLDRYLDWGSNENFKICFRDLLAFRNMLRARLVEAFIIVMAIFYPFTIADTGK